MRVVKSYFYLFSLILIFSPVLVFSREKEISFSTPEYSVLKTPSGTLIRIEGYGNFDEPGAPSLPGKLISVMLPANIDGIKVKVTEVSFSALEGQYDLSAIAPMIPSSGDLNNFSQSDYETKRFAIYGRDAYYPETVVEYLGLFYRDEIPFVQIRISPFRYNPVQKTLEKIDHAMIRIDYQEPVSYSLKSLESIHPPTLSGSVQKNSILIIGPSAVEPVLDSFVFWKECLGYEVLFKAIESIQGENVTADKIRAFLQQQYMTDEIENILLIGHRDKLPYQKLYPNPANHTAAGGIPTDLYYSQLTGSWDGDGDGYPGEFGEDRMDLIPELNIGRIPFSEPEITGSILNKIIAFEKDRGAWKNNTLFMGSISNFKNENNAFQYYVKTDGAAVMEKIRSDIFTGSTVTTLYEKEGYSFSSFECDLPLNRENILSAWNGAFGCLGWFSHGSYDAMKRKYWPSDNGNNIPESSEIAWQDLITVNSITVTGAYQPIIFANACDNGWPEKTSLARQLILDGASAIVSASREAYGSLGWERIEDGGAATLSYQFWQQLVTEQKSVGQSLNDSREQYNAMFSGAWSHLGNSYAFNLYGDPTMKLAGETPVYGGLLVRMNPDQSGSGCSLSLYHAGGVVWRNTESGTGYHIFPLTAGSYNMVVQAEGFTDFLKEIRIEPGLMNAIDVSMTVLDPVLSVPIMQLVDLSLTIQIQEQAGFDYPFLIRNTGDADLEYQLVYNETAVWIRLQRTSGLVMPGQCDSIQIHFESDQFYENICQTILTLRTNTQDSIRNIPVLMEVRDQTSPSAIEDLTLTETGQDSIILSWQATGDNGLLGKASVYRLSADNGDGMKLLKEIEGSSWSPGTSIQIAWPAVFSHETVFQVEALDDAGHSVQSNMAQYTPVTGIASGEWLPESFLYPNYPNPFNMETTISFSLAKSGPVRIDIFDIRGRLICTLIDEVRKAGIQSAKWKGLDQESRSVTTGIYLMQIKAPGWSEIQKMTVLK